MSTTNELEHFLLIPTDAVVPHMSAESTGMTPGHAVWFTSDCVYAAGCVLLQPATRSVVLIWHKSYKYWLLPRGRKDVGESLEQAALREAREESGYETTLLPLFMPTRVPRPAAESKAVPVTEPIYTALAPFVDVKAREEGRPHVGGMIITAWFVGTIAQDSVSVPDQRTASEVDFETHLFPFDEAIRLLEEQQVSVEAQTELMVVKKAIELWKRTEEILAGTIPLESARDLGSSKIDRMYWE